jgi:hypothetical protein
MLQSAPSGFALPATRFGALSRSKADLLLQHHHQGGQRLRRPVRRPVPGRDRGSARSVDFCCTVRERDDCTSSSFARRFDLDLGRDRCSCRDWLWRRRRPPCTASAGPYRRGDACCGRDGPRHWHSAAAGVAGQRIGVKDCRPTRRRVRPPFLFCLSAPPTSHKSRPGWLSRALLSALAALASPQRLPLRPWTPAPHVEPDLWT